MAVRDLGEGWASWDEIPEDGYLPITAPAMRGPIPEGRPVLLDRRTETPGIRVEDRRGAAGALLLHAAIIASFIVTLHVTTVTPPIHKDPPPVPMTITTVPDAKFSVPEAKIAPKIEIPKPTPPEPKPLPDPEPQPKPVQQPQPPQPAPPQPTAPSNAGEPTFWTPPPPPSRPPPVNIPQPTGEKLSLIKVPDVDPNKRNLTPQFVSGGQDLIQDAQVAAAVKTLQERGSPGQGMVTLHFTVSAAGPIKDCSVVSSSGSPVLDQRGCDLIKTFVYTPGTDDKGVPIDKQVSESLEWLAGDKARQAEVQQVVPTGRRR